MDEWFPTTSEELSAEIREGEAALTPDELRWWREFRIPPEKWQLHPWGDAGGGFWVVGIIGRHVVWHNDIEGGFDLSLYSAYGTIGEYGASQFELSHVVNAIAERFQKAPPDEN
jgi:hypothetical protein